MLANGIRIGLVCMCVNMVDDRLIKGSVIGLGMRIRVILLMRRQLGVLSMGVVRITLMG